MIQNTKISIIVAMDENQGIGKKNDLLFKISEDFKRMKALTEGHPIIMGRKTFESIGRVLPNRTNIIVTRDPSFSFEGTVVAHSLEDAIEKSSKYYVASSKYDKEDTKIRDTKYVIQDTENEVFIFGGGQIFKEALEKDLVDRLYLTVVKGTYDADTFFPEYKSLGFKIIKEEQGESDGYQYTFLDLGK